jgi:hypothetical protein
MWLAIWNGFPTVYPDSATYIECGFKLDTPVDRPITYGLFIAATSLFGTSLWLPVLAQSILLAATLRAFIRLFVPGLWLVPAAIAIALTGLSFLSSQVMTDLFTSIMLMCMVLFTMQDSRRSPWLWLFVVSCAMHGSHLPMALLLYPLTLVIFRLTVTRDLKSAFRSTWPILAGVAIAYPAVNISVVKSTEAFYGAHLSETGDLQEFLGRRCTDDAYLLCSLMDTIPKSAEHFLWHAQGATSRYPSRQMMKLDLGRIIRDMLKDGHSRRRIILSTLRFGYQQLGHFPIAEGNVPFPRGSTVHKRVAEFFPSNLDSFEAMRQNHPDCFNSFVATLNATYTKASLVSAVFCAIAAFLLIGRVSKLLSAITILVVIGYVLNCFINAGLVLVANRFGAKLIWMLPLMAAIIACSLCLRFLESRRLGRPLPAGPSR